MEQTVQNSGRFLCWIDTKQKVISFHLEEGFHQRAFQKKEELVAFAVRLVRHERYRVQ